MERAQAAYLLMSGAWWRKSIIYTSQGLSVPDIRPSSAGCRRNTGNSDRAAYCMKLRLEIKQ